VRLESTPAIVLRTREYGESDKIVTFLSRTAIEQLAQLADNPMHLTILLFLINRKGDAVPTSLTRTGPMYCMSS